VVSIHVTPSVKVGLADGTPLPFVTPKRGANECAGAANILAPHATVHA
jgi:hypothetical protein